MAQGDVVQDGPVGPFFFTRSTPRPIIAAVSSSLSLCGRSTVIGGHPHARIVGPLKRVRLVAH